MLSRDTACLFDFSGARAANQVHTSEISAECAGALPCSLAPDLDVRALLFQRHGEV